MSLNYKPVQHTRGYDIQGMHVPVPDGVELRALYYNPLGTAVMTRMKKVGSEQLYSETAQSFTATGVCISHGSSGNIVTFTDGNSIDTEDVIRFKIATPLAPNNSFWPLPDLNFAKRYIHINTNSGTNIQSAVLYGYMVPD